MNMQKACDDFMNGTNQWNVGFLAGKRGDSPSACHLEQKSNEYRDWMDGWSAGRFQFHMNYLGEE